jgi:hypothetical protein
MVLLRKSIPIVAWYVLSNVSYMNLFYSVNGKANWMLEEFRSIPCNETCLSDTLVTE